jgi:hypothetical protein
MQITALIVSLSLEFLSAEGIIQYTFGPVAYWIMRLCVGLLAVAAITGVVGLIVDKRRTFALVGLLGIIPTFLLIAIFGGRW